MAYLYALLSLFGGWFGGMIGSYFSKKGENLATKQDIAEITRLTKDIESKISNEVWVRQRNWQAKRDAAYELVREAASFQESVVALVAFWRAMHNTPGIKDVANPESAAMLQRYRDATRNLWRTKCIGALVLDAKVMAQVHEFEKSGRTVVDLVNPLNAAPAGEDERRVLVMRDNQERFLALVREDLLKP